MTLWPVSNINFSFFSSPWIFLFNILPLTVFRNICIPYITWGSKFDQQRNIFVRTIMWASWNPWAAWKDNFMTPHRLRQELKFSKTLERYSFPWPWQRRRSAPKSECFFVLRKPLLVRLCVVAWVLSSVFSIFYIPSFGDCHRLRHQEIPQKMQNSLRSLSKDVFERRTSTGSAALTLTNFKCIANFLFSYKDDLPESFNKNPLPVDLCRSKTLPYLPVEGACGVYQRCKGGLKNLRDMWDKG